MSTKAKQIEEMLDKLAARAAEEPEFAAKPLIMDTSKVDPLLQAARSFIVEKTRDSIKKTENDLFSPREAVLRRARQRLQK